MHGKFPNESGVLDFTFDHAYKTWTSIWETSIPRSSVCFNFQRFIGSHQPKGREKDRELEIIHELAERVLPFGEAISAACDICAELDCLLCFAEATNQYNYRRPQMSDENVINIEQGR